MLRTTAAAGTSVILVEARLRRQPPPTKLVPGRLAEIPQEEREACLVRHLHARSRLRRAALACPAVIRLLAAHPRAGRQTDLAAVRAVSDEFEAGHGLARWRAARLADGAVRGTARLRRWLIDAA